MSAARKYIQPYLYQVFDGTQHNNLIFNPDKTTCILLSPYPAVYNRYKVQGTTWGKQKEIVVATYKAVMRPTLEYVPSIWSPIAYLTNINKLQVMQNAALKVCTGYTHDTNILVQDLHDETNILPIQKHLQLHASQVGQKAQYPSLPLYRYTTHNTSKRLMKPTGFNNS